MPRESPPRKIICPGNLHQWQRFAQRISAKKKDMPRESLPKKKIFPGNLYQEKRSAQKISSKKKDLPSESLPRKKDCPGNRCQDKRSAQGILTKNKDLPRESSLRNLHQWQRFAQRISAEKKDMPGESLPRKKIFPVNLYQEKRSALGKITFSCYCSFGQSFRHSYPGVTNKYITALNFDNNFVNFSSLYCPPLYLGYVVDKYKLLCCRVSTGSYILPQGLTYYPPPTHLWGESI